MLFFMFKSLKMKRIIAILALLLLVGHVYAQIVYHDAANFPLLGKVTNSTGAQYERFPDSLKMFCVRLSGI